VIIYKNANLALDMGYFALYTVGVRMAEPDKWHRLKKHIGVEKTIISPVPVSENVERR